MRRGGEGTDRVSGVNLEKEWAAVCVIQYVGCFRQWRNGLHQV